MYNQIIFCIKYLIFSFFHQKFQKAIDISESKVYNIVRMKQKQRCFGLVRKHLFCLYYFRKKV